MYNMTTTKNADVNKKIFIPVLAVGVAANALIVFKITKKHWYNLLPIHVYQINIFSGMFLLNLSGTGTALLVAEDTFICSVALFLSFFARLNFVVDIFALQFDRLWAISKPLYHHSEVTSFLSWKIVLTAKIFTLMIVTLASVTEPGLVKYQQCHRCIFVHPVNVWLHSFPALAAFLLTLLVSIFASAKVIKLNKVSPAISLGRNTMNILKQQQKLQ